jgi:hypothetical protein
MMVFLEGADLTGSYQLTLQVQAITATNKGQDIKAWISARWWPPFNASHPEGDIKVLPWPTKTPHGTMVTLPDPAKPEIVFKAEQKDERPAEVDWADMEKWGAVEKPRKARVGPKGDPQEAYRGVLFGNRKLVGPDLEVRFAFKTQTHFYFLTVNLTMQMIDPESPKWKAMREALESFELLPK